MITRSKAATGTRRRNKYTEQPFPEIGRQVHQQTQSRLFELPKESRDKIFGLTIPVAPESIDLVGVFRRKEGTSHLVNLGDSAPPSLSLIRTCRLIHDECKATFESASRAYWQKVFIIDLLHRPNEWAVTDWLPDVFAARISKYNLKISNPPVSVTLRLKTDGYWHLDVIQRPDTSDKGFALLVSIIEKELKDIQARNDEYGTFQTSRHQLDNARAFTSAGLGRLLQVTGLVSPISQS